MKEQKFEKVVEYERGLDILVFFISGGLIFSGVMVWIDGSNTFIEGVMSALFLMVGTINFFNSLPKGRKIYWRRVK